VNLGDVTFATAYFTVANGVAFNGTNLFVAVGYTSGSGGTIKYSGNGSVWSNAASGEFTQAGSAIAYNRTLNLWIAAGKADAANADTVRYSGDGSNWSNSTGIDFPSGLGIGVRPGSSILTGIQNYYNQVRFFDSPLPDVTTRQVTPNIAYSSSNLVLNNTALFDTNQNISLISQSSLSITAQSTFFNFDYTNVTETVSTQSISIVGAFTLGSQYV
jgi:hypothetical protein